jgi:hypothetical protein
MTVRRGPLFTTISLCMGAVFAHSQDLIEPPLPANPEAQEAQGSERSIEKFDEVLTIEWREKTILAREGKIVFGGGIKAIYGPTVLYADSLTVSQKPGNQFGVAEGNIRLEDPDGTMRADYLEFHWVERTGSARNVVLDIEGLHIEAGSATLKPDEWTLNNVRAAPDGSNNPLVAINSPTVVYRPGQSGVARRASLRILGNKIVTLPSYRFGSKREEQTLRFPSVSFNQGLGFSWRTALPLDDRSRFNGSIRARAGEGPGIGAQVTRSFLPRNEPEGIISPASELGERFNYGYFDNVYVVNPQEEFSLISARRGSLGLGLTVNEPAIARLNRDLYTKAFDVVFEQARPFSGLGVYSSLRFHDIREEGGLSERRMMASVTTVLPSAEIAHGLRTHARIDSSGYVGDRNTFGWATAQLGLIFQATPQLTMGAAFVRGRELGSPTFSADRLFSRSSYHLRMDADFGTTRLSYLAKYDNHRNKWFDNEISLSQTVGSIIPFVSYREFPRSFTFGVRLKAEETLAKLGERFRRGGR